MNDPLFWIGIRESEIKDCNNLFTGSVTIFGSGRNGNLAFDQETKLRYDYNQDNDKWNSFVERQIQNICIEYPNARFLLYYPSEYNSYGSILPSRLAYQNDDQLMNLLEDKQRTRSWLSNSVPILPYMTRMGENLTYKDMCQAFPEYLGFVVQAEYSCGGSGTYYVASHQDCKRHIDADKPYSVSPFIKNSISPNVHMIIYENDMIILPPSIQLFASGENRFSYRGADYAMFSHLPINIKQKVFSHAAAIGERLRLAGYRGICGVDFLCDSQGVYLMEINARFQSSSFLINTALHEKGVCCSLQALHIDAFLHKTCSYHDLDISVDYSFWGYFYDPQMRDQLKYLHTLHSSACEKDVICVDDCLDWNMRLEEKTYLFKSIFHGNIASLSPDLNCRIHGNICVHSFKNRIGIFNVDNAIKWKIMLLNHGVRIHPDVLEIASHKGGFNFEEFSAVDMVINRQLYVNVPYCANRSQISPFEIIMENEQIFKLCYVGNVIADVDLRYVDKLGNQMTSSGIMYNDIAYMSNDRLRVYHRPGCFFKENSCGCGFCDVAPDATDFSFADIKEVLMAYKDEPAIHHYLIGGGSNSPFDTFTDIINLTRYIRSISDKPIYLMSLPPRNTHVLYQLKEVGITEVAFNLEVYDRQLALKYMPGKAQITLDVYQAAFKEAVCLWGNSGNVRSIFVVGLESEESILKGIEYVCQLGVSPILSLFKPIDETPLSHLLAPSDSEIHNIYLKAVEICQKYEVPLGPACHFCEDNTLKVSFI